MGQAKKCLEERAKLNLFQQIESYIVDGWSDCWIREFNKEGFEIKIDDICAMETYKFHYSSAVLTDDFLKDVRRVVDVLKKSKFNEVAFQL